MDLRPGFKQTEIGAIPESWEARTIIEICSRIHDYRGRTPKKLGMQWGGGEIPALSAGNIKKDHIDFSEECYFGSEALYKRWMTGGDVAKHDLVFTTEAPLGNVSLIPDDRKYILSQRVVLLQLHPEKAHGPFVFQVILSEQFQKTLLENATGSTAKGIQRKRLEELRLVLPQRLEQRAIAEVLGDVDALIGALDKLIAKKRDLKQAAMQQLFTGQTRLTEFDGEWTEKRLGDLGATFGGLVGKTKSDFAAGTGRYITFVNVMTNVVLDCTSFASVKVSPNESQNRAAKGDLFFNGSSETPDELAMCSVLLDEVQDVFLNSFCFGFRLFQHSAADALYLAYFFRSGQGRLLLKSLAQGAIRYNLSKAAFLKLVLRCPGVAEQTAIATILSDMDAELAALEARREKIRALKQGMMQELLTGRIRLV